jgi:ABC-type transport system involved in multi-copper enzyme maturation permease subunit
MDAVATQKPVKINRWLPYWAVFQADVRQTLRSWIYRLWVLISVLAAVGYLIYRRGIYGGAGVIQTDTKFISDLLSGSMIGSVTLIIALTVGCIASERGTMADSVLSRGISRYQYFMGKWHARLTTVLGTFLVMGILFSGAGFFLLYQDGIKLNGAAVALLTVAGLLATVVTLGVTVSAISNSTLVGMAVLWLGLCGLSFSLPLVQDRIISPGTVLNRMPNILKGDYDLSSLGQLLLVSMVLSLISAVFGMAYFARRDV